MCRLPALCVLFRLTLCTPSASYPALCVPCQVSEEDVNHLEDELRGKTTQGQWQVLCEVAGYMAEERAEEAQQRVDFEAWEPSEQVGARVEGWGRGEGEVGARGRVGERWGRGWGGEGG